MTDLELNIYEAERYGEIDEDTRDMMLEMVAMEYTAKDSRLRDLEYQIDSLRDKLDEKINLRKQYEKGSRSRALLTKQIDNLKSKIIALDEEETEIRDRANNDRDEDSYSYGRKASLQMARYGSAISKEAIANGQLKKMEQKRNFNSYKANNDRLANRQDRKEKTGKSDFRTTRGLTKESTDDLKMNIYESERYGEISIEERDELLSYLD